MKLHYLILLTLIVSTQSFAVQECKNLPKGSLLEIKAPLNKWVKIKCLNEKGLAVIVPAAGMKWMSTVKRPVMLVSGDLAISSELSRESSSISPKEWKNYFIKQKVIKYRGMGVVSANIMLHRETKAPAKYGRIYKLSLVANNKRVHHLFFYATHEFPVWVLVCNDKCKTREVYRVER